MMNEAFALYGDDCAQLLQSAESALYMADFQTALQAVEPLTEYDEPGLTLYHSQAVIRVSSYTGEGINARPLLEAAEYAYSMLDEDEIWPRQWYLLAWFNSPFASGRLIDAFYMYYLMDRLPLPEMRRQCMQAAVRYGVHFEQSCFMEHVLQRMPEEDAPDRQFKDDVIAFFICIYRRDIAGASQAAQRLTAQAASPFEQFVINKLKSDYSYLM